MHSRPSDPRNRGRPPRDPTTTTWLPHRRGADPYQPRHLDNTAAEEYSRDPRLESHRGQGRGRGTTSSHVGAGGASYHSRSPSLSDDPRRSISSPFIAPSLTPQYSNDTVFPGRTERERDRYSSQSQPAHGQPHPLFPTTATTAGDHGHTHATGHPLHSSHHDHMIPSPQLELGKQTPPQPPPPPPCDGAVSLRPLPPPLPPPPSWFNPATILTMPGQPPQSSSYPQPTMSTPPPFSSTCAPPPPPSGAPPLLGTRGPLPMPPPLPLPPIPPSTGSPLPFPPPPMGGLPPPHLPPAPPNFPLPLPIIPPPSRFVVPPSLQQTQNYQRTMFGSKGEVPGFKPAPSPMGIEEKLGLKEESSKGEGESGWEIKRLSSKEDSSDCFINEWLKRVEGSYLRHQQQREEVKRNSIKMPEARSLLCRSVELLSSLRAIQHQLITVPSDNATLWNSTMEQANHYKEELVSIRRKFDSGDVIEHLSRKMNKTRAKRARDRRCRGQRRGFLSAREARAEAATEKWLDDRRQEELKAKTEKSVQKAATGVLGDVKRKISDLHRYISLVKALKELRDIRRDASRKKGDAPPIEADELFSAIHQSAVELLSQQSVVYEQEEHALRVLMEEELNEKMAREKARRAARPPIEPHQPPVPLLPLPLPPPMEPHPLPRPPPPVTMATPLMAIGVDTHTSIRSEWDHYLSGEGTALPSDEHKAPPTQPSSTQWAEYLQQSKTTPHQ